MGSPKPSSLISSPVIIGSRLVSLGDSLDQTVLAMTGWAPAHQFLKNRLERSRVLNGMGPAQLSKSNWLQFPDLLFHAIQLILQVASFLLCHTATRREPHLQSAAHQARTRGDSELRPERGRDWRNLRRRHGGKVHTTGARRVDGLYPEYRRRELSLGECLGRPWPRTSVESNPALCQTQGQGS